MRLFFFLCGFLICSFGFAKNQALLVGIGKYKNLPPANFLDGPKYDLPALKKVLKSKWGFTDKEIHILKDKQATKANIMKMLENFYNITDKGDHIIFYFSGHGTSGFDTSLGIPVPHGSGAIVPYDGLLEGSKETILKSLIIGKNDLVPRLSKLDKGGRHISVFFDSCFSGNAVRGLFSHLDKRRPPKLKHRQVVPRITNKSAIGTQPIKIAKTPPYPYTNVFFLSAASDREYADDINQESLPWYPTIDNKPHGAFTDALLRALDGDIPVDSDKDNNIAYEELHKAIQKTLLNGGHKQTPQSLPSLKEDKTGLHYRNIFLSEKKPPKPATTKVNDQFVPSDLKVRLYNQALTNKIEALPQVRVVTDNADIVVITETGKEQYTLLNNAGDNLAEVNSLTSLIKQIKQRAWFHQISWRESKNPFHLSFELAQSVRGNTFRLGEKINFNLKSEKDIWLVLLYISSSGDISTLYPYYDYEATLIKANRLISIPPNEPIEVTLPIGTDQVVAMAFSKKPRFLTKLIGKDNLRPGGYLIRKITRAIQMNQQSLAVAMVQLHTIPSIP